MVDSHILEHRECNGNRIPWIDEGIETKKSLEIVTSNEECNFINSLTVTAEPLKDTTLEIKIIGKRQNVLVLKIAACLGYKQGLPFPIHRLPLELSNTSQTFNNSMIVYATDCGEIDWKSHEESVGTSNKLEVPVNKSDEP